MKRRDFHKAGTLFFTAVGAGQLGFSFVPGGSFDEGSYKNKIAFRRRDSRDFRDGANGTKNIIRLITTTISFMIWKKIRKNKATWPPIRNMPMCWQG